MLRKFFALSVSAAMLTISIVEATEGDQWIDLIGDQGLSSFREPLGDWVMVAIVSMDPENDQMLDAQGEGSILTNGTPGKTKHLFSEMEHGDVEVHIEFMVPKKANSGIYFMGRYEIQILDSYGVEEPRYYHCGGIYERHKWPENYGFEGTPPLMNASRPAGDWQTYDIVFRAPRFDENGKKIKNAMFEKVIHNGILIHENQEVTGPTRAAGFGDEKTAGPLMIQGDHGPVALRNIRIRPLGDE